MESNNSSLEATGSLSPLRQAITVINHKIRNLEKRKSILKSYKDMQNAGKELNSYQKTAVAKYNEVSATLKFARDLSKQFLSIANASEKEAKKLAKKEDAAKNQELEHLQEIRLVQDASTQTDCDSVRDDFLNERNGAAQLTQADLKLLDDLYPAVTPKHEAGNPMAFTNEIQAAAEHLPAIVDGGQAPQDMEEPAASAATTNTTTSNLVAATTNTLAATTANTINPNLAAVVNAALAAAFAPEVRRPMILTISLPSESSVTIEVASCQILRQ